MVGVPGEREAPAKRREKEKLPSPPALFAPSGLLGAALGGPRSAPCHPSQQQGQLAAPYTSSKAPRSGSPYSCNRCLHLPLGLLRGHQDAPSTEMDGRTDRRGAQPPNTTDLT